jgi:hypothetical protein
MFKQFIDYYKDNPEGYWFKRRLFGWGWIPVKWQGWLVILVYIGLVLAFAFTIDENSPASEVMFTFVLPLVLLTVTLIRICYKKGEKPRWQWGLPVRRNFSEGESKNIDDK